MLAVYNIERLQIHFRLNRPQVTIKQINIYAYKLDKRRITDYQKGMVAKSVFALFSLMVAITYVGAVLDSHIYQVLRDLCTLLLAVLIYAQGSFRLSKAMNKFKKFATDFNLEINLGNIRWHKFAFMLEAFCAISWALCLFVASVFQETDHFILNVQIQEWGYFFAQFGHFSIIMFIVHKIWKAVRLGK